jgi:hypothetical protein
MSVFTVSSIETVTGSGSLGERKSNEESNNKKMRKYV